MDFPSYPSTLIVLAHGLIAGAIAVRVIMRRPQAGAALAWLLLVVSVPFAGALIYLLIGERRIGRERARAIGALRADYKQIRNVVVGADHACVDWSRHDLAARGMDRLGKETVGIGTLAGNGFELYSDPQATLRAIARDVDGAKTSVLMEFYIWNQGGTADEVLEAVIRAAQRGVSCRLLVDALGARPWWKGKQPRLLREAGVELQAALPVGLFRTFVGRADLRLHRKIVVVDGEVAWTGSMNLVDPRFFKQGIGVGQWVDAMVRLRGTSVAPLAATVIGDWILETGESIEDLISATGLHRVQPRGSSDIQVIPAGPGETGDGLLQMLLALINAARHELVLTTPYLAPDESILLALRGAAGRGVKVSLIVPEKIDSLLTRYASRSYYEELLDMGVAIYLYRRGLLHTKSITADGAISMFGTVNLDMRSLWINYEVALFVYDPEFAKQLRALQKTYLQQSVPLDSSAWAARSFSERFIEDALRLASPLL